MLNATATNADSSENENDRRKQVKIVMRVYGTPAPQGSKKLFNGHMVEASKKVTPWREAIVSQAIRDNHNSLMIQSAVSVRITFMFERPAFHFTTKGLRENAPTYVAKTPDLDKLCRSTLDGLTEAGVLRDDKFVVILHAQKVFWDDKSGALIEVEEVDVPNE